MGDIIENENISADYSMKYSDEEMLLLDDAKWYADQLCTTSKHLSAVSKSYSGKTAGEWIKERVVEDIRYYLQSTDLTIKQISTRIGFPNTSFFGKYVKKNMGATPLSIRTKNGCNQLEP